MKCWTNFIESNTFQNLDTRLTYYEISVKLEYMVKIAFRTHEGLYKFKVSLFGLTNTSFLSFSFIFLGNLNGQGIFENRGNMLRTKMNNESDITQK
jgi:hypothetical protein